MIKEYVRLDGDELKRGDVLAGVFIDGVDELWKRQWTVSTEPVAGSDGIFHTEAVEVVAGGKGANVPYRFVKPVVVVFDDAFKARRGGRYVAKHTTTMTASVTTKVIDEFPGFCPRCGRKAYVGALSVEHKNEASATDCPARRA